MDQVTLDLSATLKPPQSDLTASLHDLLQCCSTLPIFIIWIFLPWISSAASGFCPFSYSRKFDLIAGCYRLPVPATVIEDPIFNSISPRSLWQLPKPIHGLQSQGVGNSPEMPPREGLHACKPGQTSRAVENYYLTSTQDPSGTTLTQSKVWLSSEHLQRWATHSSMGSRAVASLLSDI